MLYYLNFLLETVRQTVIKFCYYTVHILPKPFPTVSIAVIQLCDSYISTRFDALFLKFELDGLICVHGLKKSVGGSTVHDDFCYCSIRNINKCLCQY